ncbi:hypothetical protein A3Q56_07623 [Intoshia linei]|uniref:PIPK domain-containing protein n=1 Tax=Intoshia linei TaxID=1819745 RepID=A0A177ATF5_9BILA|nr:hypothetical protein A3Q56_07623 [Intoshia linei]
MGLIDILQNYRASKKLEHGFKSILFDGKSISVTEPTFYEKRFTSFLSKFVFTCEPTIKVLKRNSTKKDLKRYSITTSIKIKQESNKILSFVETPPPPFTADKQSATSSIKISNVSTTTKLVEPTFNEDEHSMTIRF